MAPPLVNLGIVASQNGDYERATHYAEESLDLYREIGFQAGMMRCHNNLSTIAARQKHFDEAQDYLSQALAIAREINEKEILAIILINLGEIALDQNNPTSARGYLAEALQTGMQIGAVPVAVQVIPGFARACELQGDKVKALELLSFTLNHPACISEVKQDNDAYFARLQTELAPETVQRAIERGKHLALEVVAEELT
jgi:tetratricopeptide (TPR) repeat protein